MILIACVEDRMGMMLNHRRLSRDRILNKDMADMCQGQCLYMESYTAKLFEQIPCDNIRIIEETALNCLEGNYLFAENPDIICEEQVEKIVLYHWNRKYPADQYFPIDLNRWNLIRSEEFKGYSHEKITKELYEKKLI